MHVRTASVPSPSDSAGGSKPVQQGVPATTPYESSRYGGIRCSTIETSHGPAEVPQAVRFGSH